MYKRQVPINERTQRDIVFLCKINDCGICVLGSKSEGKSAVIFLCIDKLLDLVVRLIDGVVDLEFDFIKEADFFSSFLYKYFLFGLGVEVIDLYELVDDFVFSVMICMKVSGHLSLVTIGADV